MNKKSIITIILKAIIIFYVTFSGTKYSFENLAGYAGKSFPDAILFVLIWICCLATLIWLSVKKNSIGKIILIAFLGICGLLNDMHYTILEDSLSFESLTQLWHDRSLTGDAFKMYWFYTLGPILRIILFYVASFYPVKLSINWINGKRAYFSVLISMLLISKFTFQLNSKGIEGMPSQLSIVPFFASLGFLTYNYSVTERGPVKIPVTEEGKIEKIVLIIDESIRGDYIDLNYQRNTTPYLASLKSKIVNYGLAVSSYNRSAQSHSIIRMGIGPKDFLEYGATKMYANPLIWEYAHKAGYKTAYIDAQKYGHLQNQMNDKEAKLIDSFNWIKPEKGKDVDYEAAKLLRKMLQEEGRQFIYVIKDGVHFHYDHRYPANAAVFKPTLGSVNRTWTSLFEEPVDKASLINSYKNAIRWRVDGFFKVLLESESLKNTLIIYTSDHGENLLDDKKQFVRGRLRYAVPQEFIIPMLIITDNKAMKSAFEKGIPANLNKTCQFQLFPTFLYLMGYDKKEVEKEYYNTLIDPVHDMVGYFYGNLKFGKIKHTPINPDLYSYVAPEGK